ncbi:MAG TPA: hypothetical protein VMF13_12780, partial [Luteitalea sp.]|nr:hypothetical protein [Luteitalea sp.]
EALADSGDVAVPAILRVVTSETAHYNSVDFAFTALALMLGEPRDPPISDSSRRAIEAAVMQRLRNFTSFTTLWKAIDVAPLVGSPKLMDALAELATSRTAVTSLGITEDVVVERTQARARSKVGLRR